MRVLIFTATAGNGHNATASTLKIKFEEKFNAEVKIVDVFKTYGSKIRAWGINKGYFFACNHFVGIYNSVFKKCEKAKPEDRNRVSVHANTYGVSHGMLYEIESYKPDLIVSTYIFLSVALSNIKAAFGIPAKIMSLTLDYGVSPYWECALGTDYMFITGEYMKDAFLSRGYKEEQLFPLGIPVKDIFSQEINKTEARRQLSLDENLFTLTVMKSGFFPIKDTKIMRELEKVEQKIQVIFVNGTSAASFRRFEILIKKTKAPHRFVNIGFTNKVGEIFSASDLVLGKAGGLTLTETITKCLPSIIVSKLPQQEIYNKEYLIENNCALSADGKNDTISKRINFLLSNPAELIQMQNACNKIRRVNAADTFMDVIKEVPSADYGSRPPISKKQTISGIKKMLKRKNPAISK